MRMTRALGSGVAGATAVTLVNEIARRSIPNAPRGGLGDHGMLAAAMRASGTSSKLPRWRRYSM